jgi:hypothetical protein
MFDSLATLPGMDQALHRLTEAMPLSTSACQEFIVYIAQFHIIPLYQTHPPQPRDPPLAKWYTFARSLASLIHHRLTNNHGILYD